MPSAAAAVALERVSIDDLVREIDDAAAWEAFLRSAGPAPAARGEACRALPGTEAKVQVMAERARRRQPLFHPGDPGLSPELGRHIERDDSGHNRPGALRLLKSLGGAA